jgi:hypothetical protein
MPVNFNTTCFSCPSSFLPLSEGIELERQTEASGPPALDSNHSTKDALESLRQSFGGLHLKLDRCASLIAPSSDCTSDT